MSKRLLIDARQPEETRVITTTNEIIDDFEYEVQLASMNRSMKPDIESVFMSPSDEYSFLSSSIIKDIARHQGDLGKFVHKDVLDALVKKFR